MNSNRLPVGTVVRPKFCPELEFVISAVVGSAYQCITMQKGVEQSKAIFGETFTDNEIEVVREYIPTDQIRAGSIVHHASNQDLRMVVTAMSMDGKVASCKWIIKDNDTFKTTTRGFRLHEITYIED